MSTLRLSMLAACIAAIALFPASRACAGDFDLPALMQLLGRAPQGEVSYVEEKYSAVLTRPVVSSGTLAYHPPDTVEKDMVSPRQEHYRISGEELIITRKGTDRHYPLSSQPLLSAFAASLRGLLGGNAELLRRYYQLTLTGDEPAWRLELAPLEPEVGRYIERISVSGHAGRIGQIEVREKSGDRSVLQIRQ